MQVHIARTVCSPREYARAFIVAWRKLYDGTDPTQAQCGVLYAQWMVETSGKACWCWNIGNVKVTQGQVDAGVDWYDLPGTWEVVNGEHVVLPPGDRGRRFRAFPSLPVAMSDHLAFLRNKRYAPSWPFVEAGNPDGFARALRKQGYYTAPADDYARIMVASHRDFMRSAAFEAALEELHDADEVKTDPDIRIDFPIIYGIPPLERPPLESPELDDEPPDEAA